MDAAAPEAAEPHEKAEPQAEPRKRPWWRLKIPTAVVVTLVGIALTAWLFPAFTQQWDDRQKVRELKASFADEIATATATALSSGKEASRRSSGLQSRRSQLAPINAAWDVARLRIEMKLRAYYPRTITEQWSKFGDEVWAYLEICFLSGPSYPGQPLFLRDALRLLPKVPGAEATVADLLAADLASTRQHELEKIRQAMLSRAEHVTAAVLAAHPGGYSTTTRDLIHDLLPF
jgi:hypothetical protein